MSRLVLAAVVAMAGCAGVVETPEGAELPRYEFAIDTTFTAEQADSIRMGIEFWRSELSPLVQLVELPAYDCQNGDSRCFVSLDSADPALFSETQGWLSGRCMGCLGTGGVQWFPMLGTMVGEELALVAAHEFGHRLGLTHTRHSLMAESLADVNWELGESSVELLVAKGLIK